MFQRGFKYHLLSSVAIFLFGGLMDVLLFCSQCLEKEQLFGFIFWVNFTYNGLAWFSYWKGSEFLVEVLDYYFPWLRSPIKRFLISLISIAAYVFVMVWVLDLFFDLLVFKKTLTQALERSGAPFFNVFGITLVINIFMHGRGFLLSWRQVSIDIEKLKTEQVFTQFQSLKNQVNPHFLFNSLNALSSLVYEDQDRAVEFIRKLAQVYRYVLDNKDEEVVPITDEVTFLENFIFLQRIRFGENLNFRLNNESANGFLPPLALQLLVENAIKHNVISDSHQLIVEVLINDSYCVVSNNKKEKLDKDSTGIGLNNLKERYKYLTDREVILTDTPEKFEVKIPILDFQKGQDLF